MEGNSRGGLFAKAAKVFSGGEREPFLAHNLPCSLLRKERPRLGGRQMEKSSKKTASVCVCLFSRERILQYCTYYIYISRTYIHNYI